MSDSELNDLMIKMGEAIKESLNKLKFFWLICNIITTIIILIMSYYIYYNYKQIEELRVDILKRECSRTIQTPRKINHCFRYKSK